MKKLKSIIKVVFTVYLIGLPIVVTYLADWFINNFSHFTAYETMKIGSEIVPGSTVITLLFVVACLVKMWFPVLKRNKDNEN